MFLRVGSQVRAYTAVLQQTKKVSPGKQEKTTPLKPRHGETSGTISRQNQDENTKQRRGPRPRSAPLRSPLSPVQAPATAGPTARDPRPSPGRPPPSCCRTARPSRPRCSPCPGRCPRCASRGYRYRYRCRRRCRRRRTPRRCFPALHAKMVVLA